jgi:hypothetical protein
VSDSLVLVKFVEGGAGLAMIIALIRSAIRDSIPVTPHMSANLENSIVALMSSGEGAGPGAP